MGPLLAFFISQEMKDINSFSGWGVLGGGQKVDVEKVDQSFQNHYMFNRKPLSHVTEIAENSQEFLRGIVSCNCILLEKNKETVTVMLINSEDP